MASNFVFLVHGMGVHAPGWSKEWQSSLVASARHFAPYANGGRELADDIEFNEIVYDTVFEAGFRERWKSLANALADAELPAAVKPVLAEFQGSTNPRVPEFVWTHVLDVVLWFGLATARRAVIARVAAQLADGVERALSSGATVHLLAHSLGTSVAHDTLLCLAAGKATARAFDPARGGVRWSSLVTVANVSRLLAPDESPSDDLPASAFLPERSRVQPGDLVAEFLNVRHALDPFTWPRTFSPGWPLPTFRPTNPERFAKPQEIHDLPTQLDHPPSACHALRHFTGRAALGTNDEFKLARAAYEKKYPRSVEELFGRMRQLLGGDPERRLDLAALARYFGTFGGELL